MNTFVRTAQHPFLLNGPHGDPAVWVDLIDEDHALLFDLGDLRSLPNRKLLRIKHALVSHTHLDHFFGFDQLLRVSLTREREIGIVGPRGFTDNVAGKLRGYTWNLVEDYPIRMRVEEIEGGRVRSTVFSGKGRLQPEKASERPFERTIVEHPSYRIDAAVFDHGVPVLGFALREIEHLAVNKDRLDALGLAPGRWLNALKQAVRAGAPGDGEIEAAAADGTPRRLRLDEIASEVLLRSPGQQLGYLCDLSFTEANVERAVCLVRGAQLLICEAAFLHRDEGLARARKHLTARQAGEIARAAGVERLAPFHLSLRYEGSHELLFEEAAAAFGGPIVRLPALPRTAIAAPDSPPAP